MDHQIIYCKNRQIYLTILNILFSRGYRWNSATLKYTLRKDVPENPYFPQIDVFDDKTVSAHYYSSYMRDVYIDGEKWIRAQKLKKIDGR